MYEKRNSSIRLELHYYIVYILISAVKRGIRNRITGIHATGRYGSRPRIPWNIIEGHRVISKQGKDRMFWR